jgi:hypothetical protein
MDIATATDLTPYPDFERLLGCWHRLAGTTALPRAADFHPGDARWLVGRIYLVDVLDGGADFRCRLFGLFWQTVYGIDMTGRRLSELETAGQFTNVREGYSKVVETRQPLLQTAKLIWPGGKEIEYARFLVPFGDAQLNVSRILVAGDCGMALEDLIMLCGIGLPQPDFDATASAIDPFAHAFAV